MAEANKSAITDYLQVLDDYGNQKEEILGYVMSFREHLSMEALNDLLQFLVFLVRVYEREGRGRIRPSRATVLKHNEGVRKQVEFVLGEDLKDVSRSSELWTGGFEERNLLAYAINGVLEKYDMETEEGVQMYIAVVSLILIFSDEARVVSPSK